MSVEDEVRALAERSVLARESVIGDLAERIYVRVVSAHETLAAIVKSDNEPDPLGKLKRYAWAAAREWYSGDEDDEGDR